MTTSVINLVPWSGATFSYAPGQIVALADSTATARISAGLAKAVPSKGDKGDAGADGANAAHTVSAAVSAAGTTRTDATALTSVINNVTTAASGTGVTLVASGTTGIGNSVTIYHNGVSALKVYGAGSDTIDGTSGSTGVTLTAGKRCVYTVTAANTYLSAQLGVVSA